MSVKNKIQISYLIIALLLFTHYGADKLMKSGGNEWGIGLLLLVNIASLLYARLSLLRNEHFIAGFTFWMGTLWFSGFLLRLHLNVNNQPVRIVMGWIEFILILLFLLRLNGVYEEPSGNREN